jgi:hypothetical protein
MMTRRGAMLLEMIVAGSLLGTLLVICAQLLAAAAAGRLAADQRQCALAELANVMERVAARPWSELTDAAVAKEQLSPSAVSQLPAAELALEIATEPNDSDAKRITIRLGWQDRAGQRPGPLTLTTWRYRDRD